MIIIVFLVYEFISDLGQNISLSFVCSSLESEWGYVRMVNNVFRRGIINIYPATFLESASLENNVGRSRG